MKPDSQDEETSSSVVFCSRFGGSRGADNSPSVSPFLLEIPLFSLFVIFQFPHALFFSLSLSLILPFPYPHLFFFSVPFCWARYLVLLKFR